ncbi:MAG: CopG family transcriptional regulator [Elusimicrobia bacterium]|nr:CopG family transcriptional regulator [Elusimicrobiota bacterium]
MPNKRASKLMTISLPPSLYRETIKTAREEGRTNSELVRESVRKYISDRRWRRLLDYGRRKAIETGLKPDEIEDIIDELRDTGS